LVVEIRAEQVLASEDAKNDRFLTSANFCANVTGKARLEDRCYEVLRLEDEWTSEERERVPKTGVDSTKPQEFRM